MAPNPPLSTALAGGSWPLFFPTLFPLLLAAISLGLWMALGRTTAVSSQERLSRWLIVTLGLAVWLVGVSILAARGFYRTVAIAITVGVPLFAGIGLFLITRLPHVSEVLMAAPLPWLIGTMVVRIAGAGFLVAAAKGELSKPSFVVWAGALDTFIGGLPFRLRCGLRPARRLRSSLRWSGT